MIELVIVVVVIGIIAAIAIPRMSSAAERARLRQVEGNTAVLQKAADLYAAEHAERLVSRQPDGSVSTAGRDIIRRLIGRTDDAGTVATTGIFGPYLQSWPANPLTLCGGIRIDGPTAAQNCAWRFDSATGRITPDHTGVMGACAHGHAGAKAEGEAAKAAAEAPAELATDPG